MLRVLSLVAVLVIGWAAALLLLFWSFQISMAYGFFGYNPDQSKADRVAFAGMALVAAAPAVAAWLSARYGWRTAAWVFSLLAGSFAVILVYSMLAALPS